MQGGYKSDITLRNDSLASKKSFQNMKKKSFLFFKQNQYKILNLKPSIPPSLPLLFPPISSASFLLSFLPPILFPFPSFFPPSLCLLPAFVLLVRLPRYNSFCHAGNWLTAILLGSNFASNMTESEAVNKTLRKRVYAQIIKVTMSDFMRVSV